jgi:hypothetical protein
MRELTDSEQDWLRIRSYLREHRFDLAVAAADDYPGHQKFAGTPLLTRPDWEPNIPIPLDMIGLALLPEGPLEWPGTSTETLLPARPDGTRYQRYSEVVAELAAPAVFEDRPTYRLLTAQLVGSSSKLTFSTGTYFDSIDAGEAAAQEFASASLGHRGGGLRTAIGDPCDLTRRPTNLAISTLTIRHDKHRDQAKFLLHWRDPAKVSHAGGLYQVVPVGVFQASGIAEWNTRNDFDLWHNMLREFDEELRGAPEDHGSEHAPIDYEGWPFAARMTAARETGELRAFCLGLGVDPLTFAADLLTAVVIDSELFDELFSDVVTDNAEGRVLAAKPFAKDTIEHLVQSQPLQAAGAALLSAAWRHRAELL